MFSPKFTDKQLNFSKRCSANVTLDGGKTYNKNFFITNNKFKWQTKFVLGQFYNQFENMHIANDLNQNF